VRKWSTEDGGIIQQWSDAGGTNQHWKLVLVSSPEPSPSPSPQVVKGDVNGDLKVNSTDFSMLRRYLLKIIDNFPTENGKQAADLNGDGRINSSDLTMLKDTCLWKWICKFTCKNYK